jgi:transcriptional regulator with XRE-family HTH domain
MFVVLIYFVYLLANNEHHMVNTEQNHSLNRLKIVLVEQGKSGRWLAERLNKSEHTISRWCQNKTQPSVAQLNVIAQILCVDIRTLINPTEEFL